MQGHSLPLVILCATLVASTVAAGREMPDSVERVIPPGQGELLATMLGRGSALPGNCRFNGGRADGAVATAEYVCDEGRVSLELRAPDVAPPSALRTERFAIVTRSGSAPPGLTEALAALIRSHEADLQWNTVPRLALAPFGLVAGACGIVLIASAVQYLLGRRLVTAPRQGGWWNPDGGAFASIVSTFRRRRRRAIILPLLMIFAPVAAYLTTRLPFLARLPVFVDESIHIKWAQGSMGHYILPEVLVGKWLPIQVMALYMFLPLNPLVCARLASVTMGFFTLLACVLINFELFSVEEGLLAGAFYVMLPFALLYDRLALADIYLTAFGAWSVLFALLMIRFRRPIYALAMSLSVYGAILSKPTGGLFLAIPLLVSVLLVARGDRAAYLGRSAPTLIGGAALLLFLLRGGYGTNLVASQSDFDGMRLFAANLDTTREWLVTLLTPAVAFSILAATVWGLVGVVRRRNADAFLVALLLFAVVPYALVSRVWFPRYLLFVTVPVSLLLARTVSVCTSGLANLVQRLGARMPLPARAVIAAGMMLVFALAAAPCDRALMTDPEAACLPLADRTQYISGWASGYGLPELAAFLREQARAEPINVLRFDYTGPANQGLDVYLADTESMHAYTIGHPGEETLARVARFATARRTLFISSPGGEEPEGLGSSDLLGSAVRIWDYDRPGNESKLEVWEVSRPQESP